MSRNDDYTVVNLWNFAYFKVNYRLIAIDLSKQTNLKDLQQINFTGKLEEQNNEATMFFIIEKSEKTKITKFCKHLTKIETQKIVIL